ncbi:hypothetical protein HID58_088444, partial [Brassica napus]
MLLLDSKATLMPGSSPSHHLQTALKGGFRNQNQLLGLANTNTQLLEVEFVCPMKVTGFNMDKGWCYVSCSRCTKKLQRTVSSFTWQPAVTPMQLVSFDMLDPKMSLFVDFNGKKCISWYVPTVTNGWQDFHL